MRQPLDLRQTERNSCQSLIVNNVLYTLECTPPSLRQIDKELDRQPGQLPNRSSIPIWLQYGLHVQHFSAFDPDCFIAAGIDYLRGYHAEYWDNTLQSYWTPQRIVQYQQYLRLYQMQVGDFGNRYKQIPREPELADLDKALKKGVCLLDVKATPQSVPCATMVYGRNKHGHYFIFSPKKSYSFDIVLSGFIESVWRPKRSLTVIWRAA